MAHNLAVLSLKLSYLCVQTIFFKLHTYVRDCITSLVPGNYLGKSSHTTVINSFIVWLRLCDAEYSHRYCFS